jgi:spermidine synthase
VSRADAPSEIPVEAGWRAAFFPALLFVSGYCGISYEVLYARYLGNMVGDQFAVVASVLLTFLLGIGIGTLVAHALWRFLWAIEGAVWLYALALTLGQGALDRFLYRGTSSFGVGLADSMLFAVAVLAIPAFLIGTSLPLFAGYLRALQPGQTFSRAYTLYNLGAAVTAVLIEFVLLRLLGLQRTILAVAVLNGIVAVVLLTVFPGVRLQVPRASAPAHFPLPTLSALALASVASAVFQLLGVKLIESIVGPFHETFAIVLAVVLLGQAVGSLLVARWRLSFVQLMLMTSIGLLLLVAGMKAIAFGYAALREPALGHYWTSALLKLGLAAVVMGIPAIGFGATIPALLGDQGNIARDAGRLLCVSSLANAAGFLLMAFVIGPHMDYGPTIVLLSAAAAVSLLIAARPVAAWRQWRVGGSWRAAAQVACAAGLFALTAVAGHLLWEEKLFFFGHESFDSVADLRDGLAERIERETVKGYQEVFSINWMDGDPYFFINGFTSFPLAGYQEQLFGALAAMMTPGTDRALSVGLGSGSTAGLLAQLFDHVDGVEISPLVVQNLPRMARWNFRVYERPNVHIVLDDGMHALKRGGPKYSLIVNTVNTPLYFSASKLYSVDFLRAARDRLTDDGVYATWVDSRVGDRGVQIMLGSLLAVFRDCAIASISGSYHALMCSAEPLRIRHPRVIADHAALSDFFLGRHGLVPEWLPYALLETNVRPLLWTPHGPRNTLDYPILEFELARLRRRGFFDFNRRLHARATLARQAEIVSPAMPWSPEELVLNAEIYQGESSFTDHWKSLTKGLPGFEDRLSRLRDWSWAHYAQALRTPGERWNFAARLAEDGQCDRAETEFAQAASARPTLPKPGAVLVECRARTTRG